MKRWAHGVGEVVADTLLVPLAGRNARALDAARQLLGSSEPIVFPLAQLTDGRAVLRRPYECLALAGAPPRDELGYGFATVVALLARPNRVALIDLRSNEVVSRPLLSYLLRTAPFAVGQVAASALG